MKDKILQLRSEGKSYGEIQKILKCSKSTINYYCSLDGKCKVKTRTRKYRKENMIKLKIDAGGECNICGYNLSLNALDFHHMNPKIKNRISGYNMSSILCGQSLEKAREEIKKCILLCGNCHRELHHIDHKNSIKQKSPSILRNRAAIKNEFGGKCSLCSYNKCFDSLSFHHLDPKTKLYAMSEISKYNKDKKIAYEEAKKCILVCTNCHCEIHCGLHPNLLIINQ